MKRNIHVKFSDFLKENVAELNQNFWKWFNNSEVKTKSGEPLIVYHGSKNKDFTEFTKTQDIGFHFAQSIKIAKDMCGTFKDDDDMWTYDIKPLACYLSIQNIGVLPDMELWRKNDLIKSIEEENNYRQSNNIPLLKYQYDSSTSLLNNMKMFSKEISDLSCD